MFRVSIIVPRLAVIICNWILRTPRENHKKDGKFVLPTAACAAAPASAAVPKGAALRTSLLSDNYFVGEKASVVAAGEKASVVAVGKKASVVVAEEPSPHGPWKTFS